jgi:hypothetical protein
MLKSWKVGNNKLPQPNIFLSLKLFVTKRKIKKTIQTGSGSPNLFQIDLSKKGCFREQF